MRPAVDVHDVEGPALPTRFGELEQVYALERWMSARSLGDGPIREIRPLTGGTQNILARVSRDGFDAVLRRGPSHLRPESNRTMRKEMDVLAALSGTAVPHPRLLAACPDADVLGGAAFYLMQPVEGHNLTVEIPAALEPGALRRIGTTAATALAQLHEVDHVAVGLADLGKAEGFLERQVPRWRALLQSYSGLGGYNPESLSGIEEIGAWLEQRMPSSWRPGIMHGDFHVANLMFTKSGDVAAIVDWEMATVGDPLLDLGWLLATWPVHGREGIVDGALKDVNGLAAPSDVIAAYAGAATRDVSSVDFYVVLACYKHAIVLEGTHARARVGQAPIGVGDRLHRCAEVLLERAQEVMAS